MVILLAGFCYGVCYNNHEAQQALIEWFDEIEPHDWVMIVLTIFIMLATVGMWNVSVGQKALLAKANATAATAITKADEANQVANRSAKAAEMANKQTTRSIDMMVNGERGKLQFHDGWISPHNLGANYCFKNVGRTALTILQFNVQFTVLENAENYPEPYLKPDKLGVLDYTVDSGAYYSTWEHDGIPRSNILNFDIAIPDLDIAKGIGKTHSLFAQFRIRYATVFGIDYIFRTAVVYRGYTTGLSGNWRYEEDTPHLFMGTFPSEVLKL